MRFSDFTSTPAMADRDQDRDSPEITTDTATPDTVNFIITTSPNVSLTPNQKDYLVRKFMITQKRKFAAPFRSSGGAHLRDDSTYTTPMDLEMVVRNILEDNYSSAQTIQNDIQMIVDNGSGHGALQGGNTEHGKKLLEHVKEFMRKLPVSPKPRSRIAQPAQTKRAVRLAASPKTTEKRKADEIAETQLVRKRPRLTLPTADQVKEMRYAKKQAEAYRKGKSSNNGKRPGNLVLEKVGDLPERERQMSKEAVEKKRKLVTAAGLSIPRQQNDTKDGEEVEDETNYEEECPTDDVDNPEHSEVQPSRKATKVIKVKSYAQKLAGLSTQSPTQKQIDEMDASSISGPNFLGRTASLVRGKRLHKTNNKTNGYTSIDALLPAADCRNPAYRSHERLQDLTHGELVYMIGNHLIWKDLTRDEILSYSKDALFLVVHALGRNYEGQGDVTIQYLDRRKAKAPNGKPAKFYDAVPLYTAVEVPIWPGWSPNDFTALNRRKFTHEFLSHGPVLISDTIFKQACIDDLIDDGLFKLFPEFDTPEDHKREGLYTVQVVYRINGYPPPAKPRNNAKKAAGPLYSYENCSKQVPMTEDLLNLVRKVTLNFRATPKGVDVATLEPPLNAFLGFLTFEKRKKEDPVFMGWIKEHYNAKDVIDLYADSDGLPCPGITVVADNLPGYMQYLDLVRDCIAVFSLQPLPPNVIETQRIYGSLRGRSFAYAAEDDEQHRHDVKSNRYDADAHELRLTEAMEKRSKKKGQIIESEATGAASNLLGADSDSEETATAGNQVGELEAIDDNSGEAKTLLLEDVVPHLRVSNKARVLPYKM